MLALAFALAAAASPLPSGACALAAIGQGPGSPEVRRLVGALGLSDAGALLPWKHGLAAGRDLEGHLTALTFYGDQPDDGYGVQSPRPVRYPGPLPYGLGWDLDPAGVEAVLGLPAGQRPEELAYARDGFDLRLAFVGGKLDRVRLVARPGQPLHAPPCTSASPESPPPPQVTRAFEAWKGSQREGDCLVSLLGAAPTGTRVQALGPPERVGLPGREVLRWPRRGVSLQLDPQGRVSELRLAVKRGRAGPGFDEPLPLGLSSEPEALRQQLEPALFPEWLSVLYVEPLGVRVEWEGRAGELRLRWLDPARRPEGSACVAP
jgi:hypothetical protein